MPRALIVDDEAQANALLCALMKFRGYEVVSAFDGAQAEALANAGDLDVILLDLMLPDRDGRVLCEAWSFSAKTCAIPVVVVSARLLAENRDLCFRAGACAFVPKPFTPDQLFAALEIASAWRNQNQSATSEVNLSLGGDPEEFHRGRAQVRASLLSIVGIPNRLVPRVDETLCVVHDLLGEEARTANAHCVFLPNGVEVSLTGVLNPAVRELIDARSHAFDEVRLSEDRVFLRRAWGGDHQSATA